MIAELTNKNTKGSPTGEKKKIADRNATRGRKNRTGNSKYLGKYQRLVSTSISLNTPKLYKAKITTVYTPNILYIIYMTIIAQRKGEKMEIQRSKDDIVIGN